MRVYKFLDEKFGLKTLREKQLKISTVDDLNDPFELLPYEMTNPEKRMGLRDARKVWGSQHGVLCFSADWKDPVIWAHYSDKHKGLCPGFEIPENRGQKVEYTRTRLPLPEKLDSDNVNAWLYTKYDNWAHEQEIRRFDAGQHWRRPWDSRTIASAILAAGSSSCSLKRRPMLPLSGERREEVKNV